jgi:hypothetical protein
MEIKWQNVMEYASHYAGNIPGFKALAAGTCTKTWNLFFSIEQALYIGQYTGTGLAIRQHAMISRYLDLHRSKVEQE